MEHPQIARCTDSEGAVLQAEVDELGIHLSMIAGGELTSLLLTPEAFDEFCNEVMGLIYGA